MSTFHAVVWLDHSEAHVVMFDREHMEAQRVKSRSHHKHQGKTADNAAFFPLLRSFLLLPFDQLQEIPLPMNEGVIAHELGHFVLHRDRQAEHARRAPRDRVAGRVGDRHDRVVERALDVGFALSDVLLLLAAHLLGARSLSALGRH